LAIVVPAWTLALAFVAGLAVGAVACRLVMGRARSDAPATSTAPEPAAEVAASSDAAADAGVAVAPEPVPETTPAAEASAEEEGESSEDPAAAVDDVVAELERRVKGRRSDGETDRPTGVRRGRRG
jgi:hypothetical protein